MKSSSEVIKNSKNIDFLPSEKENETKTSGRNIYTYKNPDIETIYYL